MKTYDLFKEYLWLVDIIHRKGRLALDEINQLWLKTEMSEGVPIARSTFNRHRDAILDMFGIIIECDKKDGFRYYIYNEEVLEESTIQNWMLSTLSVNLELAESKSVHDRIVLEAIPSEGEFLHRFIEAMKTGVRIRATYRRYGGEVSQSPMTLDPLFVRLFNRRWYALVKFTEPDGSIFTMAFDRIVSLELTDERFQCPADLDPARWFRDCYGIIHDEAVPVEKVVVRAYGQEVYYLRDLPLHSSQKEIATTDSYSDFELHLSPTPDFFGPLLAHGASIQVLEPSWLADEIRKEHLKAAELYKK